MRTLMMMLLLIMAGPVWASCLHVSERELSRGDTDVGASTVEWSALIENRCDNAYDADLTVQFTDDEGTVLYEVRDYVIVEREERVEVGKSVYIPSTYVEGIRRLEIVIEERERPF